MSGCLKDEGTSCSVDWWVLGSLHTGVFLQSDPTWRLGGSWVVRTRVISPVVWVISIVTLLINHPT